jgi:hypothetical protein
MFWLIALLFIIIFQDKIKKIGLYIFAYNKQEAILKIIYDGEEIATYTLNEFFHLKKYITYDFILYIIPVEHEKYDNYVIRYENIDDILKVEYTSLKCIELTDVHIRLKDKETYPIDFGRDQYFINGNVLFDPKFLKWYLKVNNNFHLTEDDEYSVTFRDNEQLITLPDYCYILIKRNNFLLVNMINL